MKKSVESDFQWINPQTGKPTLYFYELIKSLSDNGLTQKVSTVEPTNGQVLVYDAASKTYIPGVN